MDGLSPATEVEFYKNVYHALYGLSTLLGFTVMVERVMRNTWFLHISNVSKTWGTMKGMDGVSLDMESHSSWYSIICRRMLSSVTFNQQMSIPYHTSAHSVL